MSVACLHAYQLVSYETHIVELVPKLSLRILILRFYKIRDRHKWYNTDGQLERTAPI